MTRRGCAAPALPRCPCCCRPQAPLVKALLAVLCAAAPGSCQSYMRMICTSGLETPTDAAVSMLLMFRFACMPVERPSTPTMAKDVRVAALQGTGDAPDYCANARSLQAHMAEMHYEPGQDVFEASCIMTPCSFIPTRGYCFCLPAHTSIPPLRPGWSSLPPTQWVIMRKFLPVNGA